MIYEVVDKILYPWEIDMVLNAAITLCPAMKRNNVRMYPANAKIAVPSVCIDDEHAHLVAQLLNTLVDEI